MSSQPFLQSLVDFCSGSITALSTTVLAVIVAVALLNRLLTPRIDPREPPVVKPSILWIGHIIGLIRHQADYNRILHNENPHVQIAALPMLNGKLYAVFNPFILQSLLRNKTASFEPFVIDYAKKTFALKQETFAKVKIPGVYDEFTEAIHASFQVASLHQMNVHFLQREASSPHIP